MLGPGGFLEGLEKQEGTAHPCGAKSLALVMLWHLCALCRVKPLTLPPSPKPCQLFHHQSNPRGGGMGVWLVEGGVHMHGGATHPKLPW